jgi:hypothetical protein
MISSFPFLSLIEPTDPWQNLFDIQLFTLDDTKVGDYVAFITVSLVDYQSVSSLVSDFSIKIIKLINKLPYFMPKLAGSVTVQMSKEPESW